MPPIRHIIQARIEKAKYLLLRANLSIKEVAEQVGIENAYYFSRMFKQVVGVSPVSFRRTATKK
jgi:YesN/AraC family two-component response regulator